MTTLDWSALSRLVPEIALVAIFAFFNYKRDEMYLKKENERDAARSLSEEKRDAERNRYQAEQRQAFLESLRLQQETHTRGIENIVQDIQSLTHVVTAHDEWERRYVDTLRKSQ